MEFEFDKEIDALLRQTAKSETAFAAANQQTAARADSTAAHLDSDEISAYAENALPEKARLRYTGHFADCDRCRTILANLISLDSETEAIPASLASAPVKTETANIPWYRKLFAFPNPAYALGALVVLLGGFLAFSLLQNANNSRSIDVSQISESQPAKGGPSAGAEPDFSAPVATQNSNAAAMNSEANAVSSNSATTVVSNTSTVVNTFFAQNRSANSAANASVSKKETLSNEVKAETRKNEAKEEQAKQADLVAADNSAGNQSVAGRQTAELPAGSRKMETAQAAPPPTAVMSARPVEQDKEQDNNKAKRMSPAKKASEKSANESSRQTGGKTFSRRENAWYDSAYKGQSTTNVSRGSGDYKKLDSGLRSIADSLGGTVVVVWKGRAYRIQ
jgi:hypothetical protein